MVPPAIQGFARHVMERCGKRFGLHLIGGMAVLLYAVIVYVNPALDTEKLGWGFFAVMAPVFGGGMGKAIGEAKWSNGNGKPSG